MYNNYSSFIERAEIRIFEQQQSLQAAPLEIIAVDDAGLAEWQPAAETLAGPARELKYLLRAYDSKGNFDETDARPLWLYREPSPGRVVTSDGPPPRELLAAYGENDLARQQIPLGSGTVKVQGSGIPADHTVWVAGRQVPVDPQGNFAAEEILPRGTHTVEVAVLDDAGNGSLYLRDLEFKRRDLFYVGVADLTLSENRANGPVDLLQGENTPQPYDSSLDGRLAFYVNGKVSEHWRLTASADTREGPVKDLFSNFLDKSPDSLFRRIDPDYHYPTFGDDGVVKKWRRPWASSTSKRAAARTTGCGATSRSATWATNWPTSIAACTEPTHTTGPKPPPASASDGSPSTDSPPNPERCRAMRNSGERAGRSTSCATRTS